MTRFAALLLLTPILLAVTPPPVHACGPDSDCAVGGDRVYRIKMPEGHDGTTPVGAIVYAHGLGGSAEKVMRNGSLLRMASRLGVALIAGSSAKRVWAIPNIPTKYPEDIDELAYFDRVVQDAAARFPIDRDRMMATGFSLGGMMVWELICHRSERFAGFAPIAGTFWKPEPARCTAPPASVVHIHGDADPVVPLTGRKIRTAHQGDVRKVLGMYARYGDFGPATRAQRGDWRCEDRANPQGRFLEFCLFEGGHSFRTEHVRRAWERVVRAGVL